MMEGLIRGILSLVMLETHIKAVDLMINIEDISPDEFMNDYDERLNKYTEMIMDIVWKDEE